MIPVNEQFIQHQIERGKRQIDRHSVIFFDVFDTLLARDCATPSDIFPLVEERYNRRHPDTPISDFTVLRKAAERSAALKNTAPSLELIYSELPLKKAEKTELSTIEVEIELSLSTKRYTGYVLYCYAKERGRRIVAVSDMYLNSQIIYELLQASDYAVDELFVSCEYGEIKSSGKLFQIALDQARASKDEVVHFGDNPVSDLLGSLRQGLDCVWLPARKLLSYFIEPCGDRFTEHYLIPYLSNRASLIDKRPEELGYTIFGPMQFGFCQWLHEKLHKGGFQKALFCARDMKQTMDIYLQIYPEDRNLVCYFFVSTFILEQCYRAAKNKVVTEEDQKQLEYIRSYLTQIGCSGKVAMIDSGIYGRAQRMLTEIIQNRFELHGFYISISKLFRKMVSDPDSYGFLFPDEPDTRCFFSSGFLESLIAAQHGKTMGYSENEIGMIVPVFGREKPKTAELLLVQKGIQRFVDEYLESAFQDERIPAQAVQEAYLNFSLFPQRKDVPIFMNIQSGNTVYESIAKSRGLQYYCFHWGTLLHDLKTALWKGGYLARVFPHIYKLICWLYVHLNCFYLEHFGIWKDSLDPD